MRIRSDTTTAIKNTVRRDEWRRQQQNQPYILQRKRKQVICGGSSDSDDAQHISSTSASATSSVSSQESSRAKTGARIGTGIKKLAMEAQLPRTLETPRDYQKLNIASSMGIEYANSVIFSAIGPPEGAPSKEEAALLAFDMLKMHMAFEMYWVGMRWDMESERSLSGGGSDADRIPAPTTCFYVSTIALVAAACVSGYANPESKTILNTQRNGKPFSNVTALDFGSVASGFLVVSPKLISEYTPRDVTKALECIMHAWDRVCIDDDVSAYVLALRIQIGMLMLSASSPTSLQSSSSSSAITTTQREEVVEEKQKQYPVATWWNDGGDKVCMSIREKRLLRSMVELVPTGKGNGSEVISMLSSSCMDELASRFVPFAEISNIKRTMKWVYSKTVVVVNNDSRCLSNDKVSKSSAARVRSPCSIIGHYSSSSPSPSPSISPVLPCSLPSTPSEEVHNISNGTDDDDDQLFKKPSQTSDGNEDDGGEQEDQHQSFYNRMVTGGFDPCKGSIEILTLLLQYAKRTIAYGTLSTNFREHLQDSIVSPGDYGTMRARDKSADWSAKNAIKFLRGSHFLRRSYERTLANIVEILESALRKVKDVMRTGKWVQNAGYFTRSILTSDEEYAIVCTFEAMFSGRYGIEWKSTFLVTRPLFTNAVRESKIGRRSELPSLLLSSNTYDIAYGRVVMRTSCVAESLAWWLEIIRRDHTSSLTVMAKNGVVRYGGSQSFKRLTATIDTEQQGVDDIDDEQHVMQRRQQRKPILIFGDDGSNPGCGLNTAALPKSSIIVLSIRDMCSVPINGSALFPVCGSKRKCTINSLDTTKSGVTIITL